MLYNWWTVLSQEWMYNYIICQGQVRKTCGTVCKHKRNACTCSYCWSETWAALHCDNIDYITSSGQKWIDAPDLRIDLPWPQRKVVGFVGCSSQSEAAFKGNALAIMDPPLLQHSNWLKRVLGWSLCPQYRAIEKPFFTLLEQETLVILP
jgi:hypothetical protein